jgi:Cell division protein CrgA
MARQKSGGRSMAKARPAPGSKRYTPPTPQSKKRSPLWVPVAMFTAIGCGLVVIMLNYLGLLPGGEAQNSDLILGLALMIVGFVLSTQYR